MNLFKYTLALAVAAGITFGGLKVAHGELVFEDDLSSSDEAIEEVEQPKASSRVKERENLTKSEMMRRQRLREELKNEDLLTTKLEELRLQDEVRRTKEILGSGINKEEAVVEPVKEERIGSAAQPMAPGENPQLTAVGLNGAPAAPNAMTAEAELPADDEDKTSRISIMPRGGMSGIAGSMYDMESKYSFGLTLSADVGDHVAFTAGYTYSAYSVGAGSTLAYYNPQYMKRIEFNDNVIDLGARGHLFGIKSKVRPFAGGGFAYRKGYVNYDSETRNRIRQYEAYGAQDVDISGFSSYLELGVEFKLTKAISVVGLGRYFHLLSYRQSSQVNPNAFYGGNAYNPYYGAAAVGPYSYSPYSYNDGSRERAGEDLAKSNFFQIMAGVSINF